LAKSEPLANKGSAVNNWRSSYEDPCSPATFAGNSGQKTLMKRLLLLVSILGIPFCARADDTTRMIEFKIAGGKTVACPTTDAGPLPAENGPYRVNVAGIALGRDADRKNAFLIFTFRLSVGSKGELKRVVVEDVSGESAVTLVDDRSPKVGAGTWKGNAAPLILSRKSTPWVFQNRPTIKVFRITVSAKNSADVVLFQPTWYPRQVKVGIVQFAKENGGPGS
jgi:hypothetical protein